MIQSYTKSNRGEERRVNVDDKVDERVGHRRETYRTDVARALQIPVFGVSYGGTSAATRKSAVAIELPPLRTNFLFRC